MRIIFDHVPKCAGSAVINHLSCMPLHFNIRGALDALFVAALMEHTPRHMPVFITGHGAGRHYLPLDQEACARSADTYVFTMLRDPFRRFVSAYNYATTTSQRLANMDMEEYLEGLEPNFLCRWFGPGYETARKRLVERYHMVAVAECFDEGMRRIMRDLNCAYAPQPRVNASRPGRDLDAFRDAFLARNQEDQALYAEVCAHFNHHPVPRPRAPRRSDIHTVPSALAASPGLISGSTHGDQAAGVHGLLQILEQTPLSIGDGFSLAARLLDLGDHHNAARLIREIEHLNGFDAVHARLERFAPVTHGYARLLARLDPRAQAHAFSQAFAPAHPETKGSHAFGPECIASYHVATFPELRTWIDQFSDESSAGTPKEGDASLALERIQAMEAAFMDPELVAPFAKGKLYAALAAGSMDTFHAAREECLERIACGTDLLVEDMAPPLRALGHPREAIAFLEAARPMRMLRGRLLRERVACHALDLDRERVFALLRNPREPGPARGRESDDGPYRGAEQCPDTAISILMHAATRPVPEHGQGQRHGHDQDHDQEIHIFALAPLASAMWLHAELAGLHQERVQWHVPSQNLERFHTLFAPQPCHALPPRITASTLPDVRQALQDTAQGQAILLTSGPLKGYATILPLLRELFPGRLYRLDYEQLFTGCQHTLEPIA